MALNGFGSYVVVMLEVLEHWDSANTELGGLPASDLVLQGGLTRAQFSADRDAISAGITGIEDLENGRQIAADIRQTSREQVRERLSRFRGILRGTLPNTPYEKAAPTLPELSAVQSKFLAPLDDMASLWTRINADTSTPGFTPPLIIAGYALADFQTDLAGLRASFAAVTAAENDLDLARKERDALLPPAKERMVQYRAMVEATFGAEHPLTLTLPTLSSAPGSTPDAVTASGEWDAVAGEAVLTWNGSTNSNLQLYEIRVASGATYDAATASVAGQVLAGTEEFRTT